MSVCKILSLLILGFLIFKYYNLSKVPPLPVLEENPWWGPGKPGKDNPAIRPFKINVPKEDIEDLKARLSLPLRLTDSLENANFTYGFNSDVLKKIVNHWSTKYDWKKREEKLNIFPQFKTQIEGLDIYFRHVKPKIPSNSRPVTTVPVLLVHGWPGSIIEFDEVIPLLTTPQDGSDVVFEVISPSLPGYGFSQASSKQGMRTLEISQIFLKLMKRLGFEKFYVQGGDWGHVIVASLSTLYPENVLGMHSNVPMAFSPIVNIKHWLGAFLPSGVMMSKEFEELMYPVSKVMGYMIMETGYLHIQSTKPDTVGAGLSNSPVGLAAYILEKFSSWTHKSNPAKPDGALLGQDFPISLVRLLDNVSLYWFSKSITSSMRLYKESFSNPEVFESDRIPTSVYAGFSAFPQELILWPENFMAHKFTNIVFFRKHDVGGHFAAMELPQILSKDFHDFVNTVQQSRKSQTKTEL